MDLLQNFWFRTVSYSSLIDLKWSRLHLSYATRTDLHFSPTSTVHTLAELKMTGNCLKGSRPLLSFDPVSSTDQKAVETLWLMGFVLMDCVTKTKLFKSQKPTHSFHSAWFPQLLWNNLLEFAITYIDDWLINERITENPNKSLRFYVTLCFLL